MEQSIARLKEALLDPRYQSATTDGAPLEFEWVRIEGTDSAGKYFQPQDVATADDARAAFDTLWKVLSGLKKRGCYVDWSIAGGRKVMSSYSVAVAQHLFSDLQDGDMCWHLSEVGNSDPTQMHPRPGARIELFDLPVALLKDSPPEIMASLLSDNPLQAREQLQKWQQQRWYRSETLKQRQQFLNSLTETQREVLRVLSREGGTAAEISAEVHWELKTVQNAITQLKKKYADFLANHFVQLKVDEARLVAHFQTLFLQPQTDD